MIKADQTYLTEKLKPLRDVVPGKATALPDGILVDGNGLFADNFEIGIATTIETDNKDKFFLPAKAIDFIASLPPGQIKIKNSERTVTVEHAAGKSRFASADPELFVFANPFDIMPQSEYSIRADEFAKKLDLVTYASDPNSMNAIARGVYLEGDGSELYIVAMDGVKMAVSSIPYDVEIQSIIPTKAIRKMLSLKLVGDIQLAFANDRVVLRNADYTISVKRIMKDYPKFQTFISREPTIMISTNARELYDAANRAIICSNSMQALIKLQRTPAAPDRLTITTLSALSEYSADVRITGDASDEIQIAVNAKELVNALKTFGDEQIKIDYKSEKDFLLIYGPKSIAIILPVRIKV